jgi:hypothetical protein
VRANLEAGEIRGFVTGLCVRKCIYRGLSSPTHYHSLVTSVSVGTWKKRGSAVATCFASLELIIRGMPLRGYEVSCLRC